MKAVIMAGGKGTRLRPLTCTRPKPMVLLANHPVMTHTIELLKKQGFFDIGVTVQHLGSQIIDYYGDGESNGIKMRYFIEEIPLGTAGSVKNGGDFLDETFLVISGDGLTNVDLTEALRFHKMKKSLATIILSSVDNPLEYGIVVTKETGEIVRFLEKPDWGEVFSDQVNTGIYILEPEILSYIPEKTVFDFSKDLFPLLMKNGITLYGFRSSGYWCDIGNTKAYLEAHKNIFEEKVSVYKPYQEIFPGIWIGKNTEVDPTARLEAPLVIGNNCFIGANAFLGSQSFIADKCRIMEGASVKKSVLWNGVSLGRETAVRGAVLCSKVNVKNNCSIFEGAVIGSETIIHDNSVIKPEAKIWPGKCIEENSVFRDKLVWGVKNNRNLFGINGIKGEINVDLSLEQVVLLGSAFGSILAGKNSVGIGSDENQLSKSLKNAFICGLQATGQQVYDLGDINAPITRFAVKYGNLQGGVHIRTLLQVGKVEIQFLSEEGANITRVQEKKMENIITSRDFCYVNWDKIKSIISLNGINDLYFLNLKRQAEKISKKIVVTCTCKELTLSMKKLLEDIGCTVQVVVSDEIAGSIVKESADLGISIDIHGEEVILFDHLGNKIEGDLLRVMLAYILFKEDNIPTFVASIDDPSVLEELAREYQGNIIRTKSAVRARMYKMLEQGELGQKQFALEFDGLQVALKILKFLEKRSIGLAQLVKELPDFYLYRDAVDCPWEAKGRLIRNLFESINDKNCLDSIEGVKLKYPEGWVLVLPDSEKPQVRLISEGTTMEAAQEISFIYRDKIKEMINM